MRKVLEAVNIQEAQELPLEYKDEMLQVATIIGNILSYNYED